MMTKSEKKALRTLVKVRQEMVRMCWDQFEGGSDYERLFIMVRDAIDNSIPKGMLRRDFYKLIKK